MQDDGFVLMVENTMTGQEFPMCFCDTLADAEEAMAAHQAARGKHYRFWIDTLCRWNGEVI